MPPKRAAKGEDSAAKKSRHEPPPEAAGRSNVRLNDPGVIQPQSAVRIRVGVRGKKKKHAGKLGTVLGGAGDEYDVECDGKMLMFEHGELLQRVQVEITELQSKPEYNGRSGWVEGWDADKERYHVSLDADSINVRQSNVILPAGARVTVTGLVGAPQYNDYVGAIQEYDSVSGRYLVELYHDGSGMETLKVLKLKRECVVL